VHREIKNKTKMNSLVFKMELRSEDEKNKINQTEKKTKTAE
jgi:hypothetical protein